MSFKRYLDAVFVVLALVIPFWFLRYSLKRTPPPFSGPDTLIVKGMTPVQYLPNLLANGISEVVSDYVYLVDVKQHNASLGADNARLKARVRQLEHLEGENRRLRGLLELRDHVNASMHSAQVISKDTAEFFRVAQVTLDHHGASLADQAKLPVITQEGVVGITGKVVGDTVEVELLVDADEGVDVVVERTGARGFVRGTGAETQYECRVELANRSDEIEVGDLLITSGTGRRFPAGLPVAKVAKVVKRDFGIYQTVIAKPTVDFSRLREVLIVVSHRNQLVEGRAAKP